MQFNYTTESAKSVVRSTVANALAEALVLGIDNCAQEFHPLTQVQQVHLATHAIMAYDKAIDACAGIEVEASLLMRHRARTVYPPYA